MVDDDTILASLYRIKLQAAGLSVDIAESGEAGLLRIAQTAPDLVILDLMLGDMNGVEVLELLRKNEATRKLPVLVFSSAFLGSLIDAATRAGANKCLNKASCPPDRLVDEVRTLLFPSPSGVVSTGAAPSRDTLAAVRAAPPLPPPARARTSPPPPMAGAGAPPPASAAVRNDDDWQGSVRRELIEQLGKRVEEIGRLLPKWEGSAHNPDAPYLPALYRAIRAVAGGAGLAGNHPLGHVAGALEALLKEIKAAPAALTASVRRTIGQAVELLPLLSARVDASESEAAAEPLILVLDRDDAARATVVAALANAQLRAVAVGDADVAVRLLDWNSFNLVLVDIHPPGTADLDFATRVRAHPHSGATVPLVFLSDTVEFEARGRAAAGEASDFVTRPFVPMEVALKALLCLHRNRDPARG